VVNLVRKGRGDLFCSGCDKGVSVRVLHDWDGRIVKSITCIRCRWDIETVFPDDASYIRHRGDVVLKDLR